MAQIAPSILAADFSRLGELVREVGEAGAARIHVDVMDGHFVPNLSMGPVVVKGLRPVTRLPLEVHLMVEEPARFVDSFVKAGADGFIVHHEVLPDPRPLLRQLRAEGKKAGLAINPETPVEAVEPYLPLVDLVLCMTVHPGFGGQAFLSASIERIGQLKHMIDQTGLPCELEVDGGIEEANAALVVRAGAGVLVVGTGIFGNPAGPARAIKRILEITA